MCTGVHTPCGGGQDTDCTDVQVRGLSLTLQSMAMIRDGLMAITLCVCSSERLWRSLDPGVLNHPGHGLDWSTPKGVAQTPQCRPIGRRFERPLASIEGIGRECFSSTPDPRGGDC